MIESLPRVETADAEHVVDEVEEVESKGTKRFPSDKSAKQFRGVWSCGICTDPFTAFASRSIRARSEDEVVFVEIVAASLRLGNTHIKHQDRDAPKALSCSDGCDDSC